MALKLCDTHVITCYCLKSEKPGQGDVGNQEQPREGMLLLNTLSRAKWVIKPELSLLASSSYPSQTLAFGSKPCISHLKIQSSEC